MDELTYEVTEEVANQIISFSNETEDKVKLVEAYVRLKQLDVRDAELKLEAEKEENERQKQEIQVQEAEKDRNNSKLQAILTCAGAVAAGLFTFLGCCVKASSDKKVSSDRRAADELYISQLREGYEEGDLIPPVTKASRLIK